MVKMSRFTLLTTLVSTIALIALPLAAQQLLQNVPTDVGPIAVGVNPATNTVYVANSDTEDVTVINGINLQTATVMLMQDFPAAIAVNAATNKIYVMNQGAGTISVIDGATNNASLIDVFGNLLVSIAVNPVTNKIYAVDLSNNDVIAIDGVTQQFTDVTAGALPQGIAINSVTNEIYVANYCGNDPECPANGTGTVTVINGSTLQTTTVNVGKTPNAIAVNSVTNQVYVANMTDGTVTVIDGATNNTSTVNVGQSPDAVVVNQVTNQIYVANQMDNSVTVINGTNNQTTTITGIPDPVAADVDPATNKIYVVDIGNHQTVTMIDGNTNNITPVTVQVNPVAVAVDAVTNRIYVPNEGSDSASVIAGASAAALQFVPLTPCRLVDTRQQGGGGPIQGGTSRSLPLPQEGACGATIPSGAAAYSLNVTVVPAGQHLGYLTIWPTGEDQPVASTLNSTDGRTKANAAIVPAGASGAVSIYVSNTTDVLVDIDGYFAVPNSQTLQFYPLTPCRLVDTRQPDGPLGGPSLLAQQERDFPLLMNTTCIPQGLNPSAYSLNFTAVPNPSGQHLGYLSVWPAGDPQPVVSTLNNPTGTTVANAAIVPAGQDGKVAVYAYNTTDLLIDINGYFAPPGSGGYSMYPTAPCRVLDTRQNNGQPFQGTIVVNVVGSQCSPPSNAQAFVFNATVVPPGRMPYLSLWPDDGGPMPTVSTLNAYDGFTTSNLAIVPTTNGEVNAYAAGLTQLIMDISGYFAP